MELSKEGPPSLLFYCDEANQFLRAITAIKTIGVYLFSMDAHNIINMLSNKEQEISDGFSSDSPLKLPPSSFVPFEVRALKNASMAWKNEAMKSTVSLKDYAFCIPTDSDDVESYTNEYKTLLAERYGGDGLSNNGGGVRCGYDGKYQIKGIGKTPLAGIESSFWYTHGCATIEEGFREAIWGEVCGEVLPFSAARVHAIIKTGTLAPTEHVSGIKMVPRALIVREPVMRPAHLMRASYFTESEYIRKNFVSDGVRTKSAVECYSTQFSNPSTGLLDRDAINIHLTEMVERFAFQLAAAFGKRIIHGALSCSNIGMGGEFLDFGTITGVSDYGRVIVARKHPDAWFMETELINTIENLHFHLKKYMPCKYAESISSESYFVASFKKTYQFRLSVEFLKLSGVPEWALLKMDGALLSRAAACIRSIVQRGNAEPFKLSKMPDKMGEFHLNSLFKGAAFALSRDDYEISLQELIKDAALRNCFSDVIHDIRMRYINGIRFDRRENAFLFMALNSYRLNTDFPDLYRHNLVEKVNDLLERPNGHLACADFVTNIRTKAITLMADPISDSRSFACDAWLPGLIISESNAIHSDGNGHELVNKLNEDYFPMHVKQRIERIWK
ncbi:MAG: hypothetical protein NT086_16710 [Proteobacteria bacterium]|nr:hypothetical protein [Pseudomonadota bacterium]